MNLDMFKFCLSKDTVLQFSINRRKTRMNWPYINLWLNGQGGCCLVSSVPRHLHIKGLHTTMMLLTCSGSFRRLDLPDKRKLGHWGCGLGGGSWVPGIFSLLLYHCEALCSSTYSMLSCATLPCRTKQLWGGGRLESLTLKVNVSSF